MSNATKKRYWAFVVYPESAPSNWIELLQMTGLPFAISPLHDKDIEPTGEPKKPHYHVIVCYGNTTTYNNVKRITDDLRQPIPIPLDSVRGYYRYFTHMDNPDKYQYSSSDIKSLNGFNISDFVEITKSEVNQIKFQLQQLIREKQFVEYSDFMDFIQDYCDVSYYDIASSNTIFFNTYIKSLKFKAIEKAKGVLGDNP